MAAILRKQVFPLFFLLATTGANLYSLPAQKILRSGDPVYDALTSLSMEEAKVFGDGSLITAAGALQILEALDRDSLSAPGRALYDSTLEYLNGDGSFSLKNDVLSFAVDPALQPEIYYKTNEALPWIYDRYEREPFISLPVRFGLASYVALETDVYFGENRMLSNAHDNYFNFPLDKIIDGVQPIDTNMPKFAYISAGFPFSKKFGVNFRLGLGDNQAGRTETGSIILSDTMRGTSFAALNFYSPWIAYSAEVLQLEVLKYLYLHHFQIQIFNRVNVSLIEGVMVNAPLELRYFNPAAIYHGFTAWESYDGYNVQVEGSNDNYKERNSRIGSLLGLYFDARPWRHGRFYGLYAMNQFEIPSERKNGNSTVPDGMAFQAGYEGKLPLGSGYLSFGLEGIYTYPYMYILSGRGWSYYRESLEVSNPPVREWVGSPFGPDSIAGTIWGGYEAEAWFVKLSYLCLAQGENSSPSIFELPGNEFYSNSREETEKTSPSGTAAVSHRITVEGSWTPEKWLRVYIRPAYQTVRNYAHEDGRLEQGFELSLGACFKPMYLVKKR
ncbi:MAG: hypothetical protein LBE10_07870 [Treponema sp.]|nr:hypothetical protein [Treponema sp.]